MPYRWEPNAGVSGRYRDERGRFVASSTVRRELDRYLDTDDPAKALAEALRGRAVNLADWEVAMRRHVKNTHLNAIAMERGGWANMTPSDYGRAGQIIREQYGYLRGFANDIASGKQRLDGTLGTRARLYTQAGRETFYRSKHEHLTAGIDMVGSVRSARDSCSECIALDGKWFRVGDPAYKLPGQRICTKSCRCYERYGRMTADGVEMVESGAPGGLLAAPQAGGEAVANGREVGIKSTSTYEPAIATRQRLSDYDQELKRVDRDEQKEIAAIQKRQEKYRAQMDAIQARMLQLDPMSPAWEELDNEYNNTVKEMLSISRRTDWEVVRRQVRQRQRELIYVGENGARVNFVFDEGLERVYGDAARDFGRMVSADSGIDGRPVRVAAADRPRSYFQDGTVYLAPGARNTTFFHEMGHAVEYWSPLDREGAQQFLERRTRGERPVPLNQLTGKDSYREDEVATPDRFRNPYAGKRYTTGETEIISMGLEEMYTRPAEFAREDPDYFDFIFKVIRGRNW